MSKTSVVALLAFVLLGVVVYMKEARKDLQNNLLKQDASVLAFGDSLTFGYGSSKGYPEFLEEKTSLKVTNAGVNGELSAEGVLRLPSFLKSKPDLVILCHGGNDILQKKSKTQLKNNLKTMIKMSKATGAKVLLVGVPNFNLFGFQTLDIYYEVAEEEDLVLEDEILSKIVASREFKSDQVHPNRLGYEMMAQKFTQVLKENNFIQ